MNMLQGLIGSAQRALGLDQGADDLPALAPPDGEEFELTEVQTTSAAIMDQYGCDSLVVNRDGEIYASCSGSMILVSDCHAAFFKT